MPAVTVGSTVIAYEIRRSARAKRLRLTVRPGSVRVTAPRFVRRSKIEAFVASKRRWLYEKTQALRERKLVAVPERFVSGAKVLFRGRFLALRVKEAARQRVGASPARTLAHRGTIRGGKGSLGTLRARPAESPNSLRFANAFHVTVEAGLDGDARERVARELVTGWLRARALEDAERWAKRYGGELGVHPSRIRIGNQKTLWGSCSARGVVSLNWRLTAAPKPVFEYVVVHELCHLLERNHGPRFWRRVASLLPDYRDRRAWLKEHGIGLG